MTEEDTFDALRRIPYNQACAVYMIASWGLPLNAPPEQKSLAVDLALKPLGWSLESLDEYWEKHKDTMT